MIVWIVPLIWITRWRDVRCMFFSFSLRGVFEGTYSFAAVVGGVLFLFFVNCETIWDGLISGS
jgi:hypothetical protein